MRGGEVAAWSARRALWWRKPAQTNATERRTSSSQMTVVWPLRTCRENLPPCAFDSSSHMGRMPSRKMLRSIASLMESGRSRWLYMLQKDSTESKVPSNVKPSFQFAGARVLVFLWYQIDQRVCVGVLDADMGCNNFWGGLPT